MELKMKTETVHTVDYGDFEAIIKETTGKDYEFVAEQECGNDSSHTFTASAEPQYGQELWDMDMAEVEAWIAGSGSIQYRASALFDWLCAKGHIPPGNYCIEVCW